MVEDTASSAKGKKYFPLFLNRKGNPLGQTKESSLQSIVHEDIAVADLDANHQGGDTSIPIGASLSATSSSPSSDTSLIGGKRSVLSSNVVLPTSSNTVVSLAMKSPKLSDMSSPRRSPNVQASSDNATGVVEVARGGPFLPTKEEMDDNTASSPSTTSPSTTVVVSTDLRLCLGIDDAAGTASSVDAGPSSMLVDTKTNEEMDDNTASSPSTTSPSTTVVVSTDLLRTAAKTLQNEGHMMSASVAEQTLGKY
jgi:hypothetical protein